MNDFFVRQVAILRNLIEDYQQNAINLNAFIQRLEGINGVLGSETWSDAVFPIVLSLEQVNAAALEARRGLTAAEADEVERWLLELEALIKNFEAA